MSVSGTVLEPIVSTKTVSQSESIENMEMYILRMLKVKDLGKFILSNPRIPPRLLKEVIVDRR